MVNNPLNIQQDGYVAFQADGTFVGRTLLEGANVTITNPDGTTGNSEISATAGSAPASNYTLLQSTSVTGGSTQVNFSGIGIENYDDIRIVYNDINYTIAGGGLGSATLYLLLSEDGLSNFVDFHTANYRNSANIKEMILSQAFLSNNSVWQGSVEFSNANNMLKFGSAQVGYALTSFKNYMIAGTNTKINSCRIRVTTTFTSGSIAVYGR